MLAADYPVCDRHMKLWQSPADNYLRRNNGYLTVQQIEWLHDTRLIFYCCAFYPKIMYPLWGPGRSWTYTVPTRDITGNCFYRLKGITTLHLQCTNDKWFWQNSAKLRSKSPVTFGEFSKITTQLTKDNSNNKVMSIKWQEHLYYSSEEKLTDAM